MTQFLAYLSTYWFVTHNLSHYCSLSFTVRCLIKYACHKIKLNLNITRTDSVFIKM